MENTTWEEISKNIVSNVYDSEIQDLYTEVETPFDHKNLNVEVGEFKSLNPTAENIAVVIWNKLRDKLRANLDLEVTLYETPRNYVSYKGD